VLGAYADQVLARAAGAKDAQTARRVRKGVALFVVNRGALLRQALVEKSDRVEDNLPQPGFERLAFTDYYSAYVRC
jgi:hypothetical protein